MRGFHAGNCAPPCAKQLAHQCWTCLQQHGANQCKGKGKGAGKGRGKGSGKGGKRS